MTKKMESYYKKFEEKLELVLGAYELDIIDYGKAIKEMYDEQNDYTEMISTMFRYGIVSVKDYEGVYGHSSTITDKYLMKLHDVRWTKAS